MKVRFLVTYSFLLLVALTMPHTTYSQSSITYGGWIGRFGDYLMTYCESRWLSYIHNLEFYYKPFDYGNYLVASIVHKHIEDCNKKKVALNSALEINPNEDVLYVTEDYRTKDIRADWTDKEFLKIIRSEIALIDPSIKKMIDIPKDHYSVALHIRRGGGADAKLCQEDITIGIEGWLNDDGKTWCPDKVFPTRFPPDTYYIEQIRTLMLLNPDKKFYIHIFTDDPAPQQIAEKYKAILNSSQIQFGYRTSNNAHDNNVLEDFFAIMDFDALIRAASHFSIMAGVIGGVSYEVGPLSHRWEGQKLIITEVKVIERRGDYSSSGHISWTT